MTVTCYLGQDDPGHIVVNGRTVCDNVLGAMADRTCNCGYLLPSYTQATMNPYLHEFDCNYRRQVLGTGLLTVGDGQLSPNT